MNSCKSLVFIVYFSATATSFQRSLLLILNLLLLVHNHLVALPAEMVVVAGKVAVYLDLELVVRLRTWQAFRT